MTIELEKNQIIKQGSPEAFKTLVDVLLKNKTSFIVLNQDGTPFRGNFSVLIDPQYSVPLKLKIDSPIDKPLNLDTSPRNEVVKGKSSSEILTITQQRMQLVELALTASGLDVKTSNTSVVAKQNTKETTHDNSLGQPISELSSEDKFLENLHNERNRELQNLQIQNKTQKVAALHKHFEDRMIAMESTFSSKANKPSGVSAGYIAKRDSDGHLFMMKKAMKHEGSVSGTSRYDNFDSMNFVNEFVTAPLYKRMLYDRTPIIEGVESNVPGLINLRSKFLHEFQTVAEFTESQEPSGIGHRSDKLKRVQGAEKLFAAMICGGEYDIHAGNIGVMSVKDETGKDIQVFSKIDHGWSATQFFTDPKIIMENFANAFTTYNYQNNIDLNISKFKTSIDEFLTISDQEIETMVKARTTQLKKMGFDIRDLEFPVWVDDKVHSFNNSSPNYITFNDFEELEKHYLEHYKKQREAIKGLSQTLGIIEKIEPSPQEWKNGKWISEVRDTDPIAWSVINGKQIEGRDPIAWAAINGKQIEGKNPINWAIDNARQIQGVDPIMWAMNNNKLIDGKDPVVWAMNENKTISGFDPIYIAISFNKKIEGQNPIFWTINNNHKIENKDPILWTIDKGLQIEGKDPIYWAIENKKNIAGSDPLIWAMSNNRTILGFGALEFAARTTNNIKIEDQHPIAWAAVNGKQIEGKDPILWARVNKKTISKEDPILWAAKNGIKVEKRDPIRWAFENSIQIESKPPILWAINKKQPIEGVDAIVWAVKKGIKIENKDPILWAHLKNLKLEGRDAVEWAVANNQGIEGKDPLEWASARHKAKAKTVLEKHLEDKKVSTTQEFKKAESKQAGVSTGYVADRKSDKQRFLLKHAFRKETDVTTEQQRADRRDLVNEFIMAPLYKRFLFDRTPIIELVNKEGELKADTKTKVATIQPNKSEKDIYIRSKFLDEFQMLGNFSGNEDKRGFYLNNNPQQLNKIEGFEKVIAASLILGEVDFHPGNIGVVKRKDNHNNEHYIAVKIDHGRSALDTFTNETEFREGMLHNFKNLGYMDSKNNLIMPLNATLLQGSIDQMLNVSTTEITNIVQSRVKLLKQAGFDFTGTNLNYHQNIENQVSVKLRGISEIEKLYITRLQKQLAIMKEFSETLDVIAKSDAPDTVKNSGWLSSLGRKDPILWAIEKGYKIEDKDPILWAIASGHKIEGKDPVIWTLNSKTPTEIQKLLSNHSKLDLLTPILATYTTLKENGGKKGDLAKLENMYDMAIEKINPSTKTLGLIDKESDLGKMLISKSSENIANYINKMKHDEGKTLFNPVEITSAKFMQNCSLDIVYKMSKVDKLLTKKEEAIQKGDGSSFFSEFKNALSNTINHISGKSVSKKEFNAASEDIRQIGERTEVSLVKIQDTHKAKGHLNKFTKKIAAERSAHQGSSHHI